MSRHPRNPVRAALVAVIAGALAAASAGCGSGPEVHSARGVVQEVSREEGQVVIAHEDIPGLMPAMTMSFDVPDAKLLDGLAPGQEIEFKLSHATGSYRVVAATVIREGVDVTQGGPGISGLPEERDPAAPFRLIDQSGDSLSLGDLRGRAVVLDFIFTNCPGPCPILTGLHVRVQRALDPALTDRIRFVSITLDPARDTPAVLRRYAEARGADLATWSFLTGTPGDVEAVALAYGVGSVREEDGNIAHMVVTFLIDGEGRIVRRYIGLEGDPEVLRADVERLARGMPGA